ncbi:hypothetical protein [Nakamurella sp.]|uniref:hypothetical protein n=1 Tax=Nakamurella sp. TaxID=1869182 RepID=UPI003B3BD0CC
MPHDPTTWDALLPAAGVDRSGRWGTTVDVGAEADGQIVVALRGGPALFVSFDRDEDPSAPATTVDLTLDWTRLPGPPASGISPLLVAWTGGGGVLQLAPEEPDPWGTAPGARVLGGPEFVLRIPPREVSTWIDRLLRLPRRCRLDPRPEQLVWLGGLDPSGRLQLTRLRRTPHRIELTPAGTAAASDLGPVPPLVDLLPAMRTRWAGATEVIGPSGRLIAELFAVESSLGPDGTDRTADQVVDALDRSGWTRDGRPGPPVWRQAGDGVTRWFGLHQDPARCPVPLQVPELAGATCWIERGELLSPPAAAPAPSPRRRRFRSR